MFFPIDDREEEWALLPHEGALYGRFSLQGEAWAVMVSV